MVWYFSTVFRSLLCCWCLKKKSRNWLNKGIYTERLIQWESITVRREKYVFFGSTNHLASPWLQAVFPSVQNRTWVKTTLVVIWTKSLFLPSENLQLEEEGRIGSPHFQGPTGNHDTLWRQCLHPQNPYTGKRNLQGDPRRLGLLKGYILRSRPWDCLRLRFTSSPRTAQRLVHPPHTAEKPGTPPSARTMLRPWFGLPHH